MTLSSASKSCAMPPASSSTVSSVAMELGVGLLRGVEAAKHQQRHGLHEAFYAARLVEKRFVLPERDFLLEQAIAEAGEVQHLDRRLHQTHPARELVAGHLRHHQVGDED